MNSLKKKNIRNVLIGFMVFIIFGQATEALALDGCTLLVDNETNQTIKKEGDCDTEYSPASTFKIALAIMGFDAGILMDSHNPEWSNKASNEEIADPELWEKNSVVWYSQKLTSILGMKKFRDYVMRFNYGNKDLSGDNALTNAWLGSSLKISPTEQVEFIRDILNKKLLVSAKSCEMMESILPVFDAGEGWKVTGKTGSTGSVGWFVGWAEKNNRKIIFAKLILDENYSGIGGLQARKRFLTYFQQNIK